MRECEQKETKHAFYFVQVLNAALGAPVRCFDVVLDRGHTLSLQERSKEVVVVVVVLAMCGGLVKHMGVRIVYS